jgi:hypothetical protein
MLGHVERACGVLLEGVARTVNAGRQLLWQRLCVRLRECCSVAPKILELLQWAFFVVDRVVFARGGLQTDGTAALHTQDPAIPDIHILRQARCRCARKKPLTLGNWFPP